jgi:hypothetical protein
MSDVSNSEELVDIDKSQKKKVIKAANEQSEDAPGEEKFYRLLGVINSRPWAWFIAALVLVSLFLQDVNMLAFPPEADGYITAVYVAIAVFFIFEFVVLCVYQNGYLCGNLDVEEELGTVNSTCTCSLFFWSDIIALLSIIPDLIPLSVLDESYGADSTNTIDLVIAGVRVLRLFRLWRIFRVLKLMDIYTTNQFTFAHKLGKHLSTFISMKVGIIVILVTASYVMIDYDTPFNGPKLGLEILERLPMFGESFNSTLNILTESYPCVIITMFNKTVYANGDDLDEERGIELEEFKTTQGSLLVMDINEVLKGQAALNIVLICFVMICFIVITCIVRRDVKKKAIKPMHDITDRLLQVGTAMGLFKPKQLERMYKSPHQFFNELIDSINKKIEANKE